MEPTARLDSKLLQPRFRVARSNPGNKMESARNIAITKAQNAEILPTLFIPHGGGPCFFMQWDPPDTWQKNGGMAGWLGRITGGDSEAIVVVSGHWEQEPVRITGSRHPALIYDYSGFPPHTYQLQYPAPGSPALARQIADSVGPTENIGPAGLEILRRGSEEIYLSAVSSWEIAIKAKLGKFKLSERPAHYVRSRLAAQGIRPLSITNDHSLKVYDLPLYHHDPFDRLLIAQALLEGMTILTSDRAFRKYPAELIWCG